MKFETIAPGCKLVQGDSYEILNHPGLVLDYQSVVTDPPYGTGHWKREHRRDNLCKPRKEEWDLWNPEWVGWVMKRCDRAAIFCPQTKLHDLREIAERLATPWRLLMWIKDNPNPRPFKTKVLDNGFDPIFTIGRIRGNGLDWRRTITRHDTLRNGDHHPHQKPLSVVRWLVRLTTPPGGTVLDPFAGSGTTGVAALLEGRKAILIEREPGYCDMIRRRMDRPWPQAQYRHPRSGAVLLTDPDKDRGNGRKRR